MMYLYFDSSGEIKSISPDPVDRLADYKMTTVPVSDVEAFMLGKKNLADYHVKQTKTAVGMSYAITRKHVFVANYVRTVDTFLAEVTTMPTSRDAFVLVENFLKDRTIRISISPVIELMLSDGSDEDQEVANTFIGTKSSSMYFTNRKDPYFLLHTVKFSPLELFNQKELLMPYEVDLSAASLYTMKLFDKYSYVLKQR